MKKILLLLLILMLSVPVIGSAEETADDPFALPLDMDFPNYAANPDCFDGLSYHDETLDIRIETVVRNDCTYYVAHIKVASPTQLRTAIAGEPNVSVAEFPSVMGRQHHAVLVINGEFYTQRTSDIFICRQGEMYRSEPDPVKDVLIIDSNGDFHTFTSSKKEQEINEFIAEGNEIYQAFSFGPALISKGEPVEFRRNYYFYPNSCEWRTFIGQEGPLSYVCVATTGCTHKDLITFAETLGLQEAYNLDGGFSSVMLFNNEYVGNRRQSREREQSDIIYFVTAIPDSEYSLAEWEVR